MGLALRLLGRLLFVVLFVGAGIQKVQQPADSVAYLNTSYQNYHQWVTNTDTYKKAVAAVPPQFQQYVNLLKEYTQPRFVQDHSTMIITYVGYFEVAASVLVIFGAPMVGFLLYVFTIACIVIMHNPFVNPAKFHQEFVSALLNLAIAGISLFIASDVSPVCYQNNTEKKNVEKKADKKVEAKKSEQPAPSQPKAKKNKN